MRKTKVFTLVLMILNVALLGVLIFALLSVFTRVDEAAPVASSAVADPAASAPEAMGDAGDDGLDAWIANMKTLADKHSVNAYFLQELFPDQIVYKFRGDIIYADVDPSLPLHSYDWNNLAPLTPREGEWQQDITAYSFPLTYAAQDGATGIFGIDVSKYQGKIDWQKVKDQGVQYVFIRVGYRGYGNGEIKLDEYFEEYMKGAAQVGIPVGVYFFSQATTAEEAVEEAEFVLDAIAPYNVTWPVVFDMEEVDAAEYRTQDLTAATATDVAIAFCERVREAGHTPMIYGNVSWLLSMMELDRLGDYDLWFAQYRPVPWYPYQFTIWQYSHVGALDGIEGEVDFNISFVDYGKD